MSEGKRTDGWVGVLRLECFEAREPRYCAEQWALQCLIMVNENEGVSLNVGMYIANDLNTKPHQHAYLHTQEKIWLRRICFRKDTIYVIGQK